MEVTTTNANLNLNPARADKYHFALGDIPSIPLLAPGDMSGVDELRYTVNEKSFFHLGIKSIDLPGLSLGEVIVGTAHADIKDTNMRYAYENITSVVKVDNNYLMYKMLILWMYLMNRPDEYNQFASDETFDRTATTAILTINDNFNNPVISFEFYDLRPLTISSLPLTYETKGDELYLTVTWQYTYFMPRQATGQPYELDLAR
jgi:hypothetical protein